MNKLITQIIHWGLKLAIVAALTAVVMVPTHNDVPYHQHPNTVSGR